MREKRTGVGRREYLTAAGVAVTTALAGCGGGGSTDGDPTADPEEGGERTGPAEFADVAIEAPTAPSVRSEFTVTVAATNTGGEAGTFSDTLSVVEGNSSFQEPVELADVQPGATGTTEVTLAFEYADEYVLALEEAAVEQSIAPEPLTRATGEPLSVGESLRLTLDSVNFRETVPVRAGRYGYYVNAPGDGVFTAPTDTVLALARFTVENTGTSTERLGFESLVGPNDNVYTALGESGITAVSVEDPFLFDSASGGAGDVTRFAEVEPSQRQAGWVLAQFSREDARDGVALQFQADATDTPPEAAFVHAPDDGQFGFPQYRLDSVQAESIGSDGSYEVSATVTNTGDGTGTFDGVLQWQGTGDKQRWLEDKNAEDGTVRRELGPGETREFSVITQRSDGVYAYRFAPFTETVELDFG